MKQAKGVWRDTNRDLEAVLLSPVIDERRRDKEKVQRTERGGHGKGEMRKGQQEAFYYLYSNGAMGERIRVKEKCQSPQSLYYVVSLLSWTVKLSKTLLFAHASFASCKIETIVIYPLTTVHCLQRIFL